MFYDLAPTLIFFENTVRLLKEQQIFFKMTYLKRHALKARARNSGLGLQKQKHQKPGFQKPTP